MRGTKPKFTRYANLTDSEREWIRNRYREIIFYATDPGHAAAIVASDIVTANQWAKNAKIASDAFAAVIATLTMGGCVKLIDRPLELTG